MGMGPRDIQHVVSKIGFAEKVQDVQDKNVDNRNAAITQEMKQENERRSQSVNATEKGENSIIDERRRRREEQERKKREKRQKEIAKRIKKDTGHIIDLEA
jgi:hypothetical protein